MNLEKMSTPQPITTQTQALQVLVGAINVAQSRGAFKIDESARIAEAVNMFKSTEEQQKPQIVEDADDSGESGEKA